MSLLGLHRTVRLIATRTKATVAIAETKNQTQIKAFNDIPGPTSFPVIGSTWLAVKYQDQVELGAYMHKTYGDVCALRNLVGVGDAVMIFDVKDIEMMFRNEGSWPRRQGFHSIGYYRNVMRKEVFGDIEGLLTSNDEPWADFRSKVNPILMQPRTAQQYITSINDVADDFIERTTEFMHASPVREMPTDYLDEIHKWALESIGIIALDTRLGCIDRNPTEESHNMAMYMLDIFRMTHTLDFSPLAPFCRKFNLPIWQRFVKYQDFFTNKVLELIEEATRKVENDPNYALKSETDKSAFEKLRTKGKILSVVMTLDMLAAGIDTTGKVSAAILYFLAANKEVQHKLREEVTKALPGSSDFVTKESLEQLQYLRAVVKETMRIAPVTSANLRVMTKDVTLGGYNIPEGKAVIVPHLYLSLSEQHYKNAHQFKPERWMRGDPASELKSTNPFVSMPFGFGPRSCIGKRLANLEIEVFIAKMVKKFDISWNHAPMTFGAELLYGVKDPLKIQLTPLTDK